MRSAALRAFAHTAAGLTLGLATLFAPLAARAQSVALSGVVGNRALLVVDGNGPKMVAPGETFQGVKVLSASSDAAQVEIGGKRLSLRMGDSPVSVGGGGGASAGTRIVLPVDRNGHFFAQGQVNGGAVNFMVDTGASLVVLSMADADRMGIAYKQGQPVRTMTANGQGQGYLIRLDTVRIGDVQVTNVDAAVITTGMPFVLLGNSFLARFAMQREGDQLVLQRRF